MYLGIDIDFLISCITERANINLEKWRKNIIIWREKWNLNSQKEEVSRSWSNIIFKKMSTEEISSTVKLMSNHLVKVKLEYEGIVF